MFDQAALTARLVETLNRQAQAFEALAGRLQAGTTSPAEALQSLKAIAERILESNQKVLKALQIGQDGYDEMRT